MIWLFAFIIPVVATAYMLLYHRKEVVWWETTLNFIATGIITLIVLLIAQHVNTLEIEYWGSSVDQVNYYEDWDEWIEQTCYRTETRTRSDGSTYTVEIPYDCSYRDYHPEYWTANTTTGESFYITEYEYKEICTRFGTTPKFVNMYRDYYTDDGDKYECYWNNTRNTHVPTTTKHRYVNKVRNSDVNLFNMREITEEEAEKLGLIEYPRARDPLNVNPILGYSNLPKTREALEYLNSTLGSSRQVRVWFIVYKDKDRTIANDQENYWVRGNKNEIIITMSVNSSTGEIDWVYPFSWSMIPTAEIREEIAEMEYLNDSKLSAFVDNYLYSWVSSSFDRREFAEFDYLKPEYGIWTIIIALVLVIISNVFISAWVISNEYYD